MSISRQELDRLRAAQPAPDGLLTPAQVREHLAMTPLGAALLRQQDAERQVAEPGTPLSGLSKERRRELLGLTPAGNAQLLKEDIARTRGGR